jgi:hypothetical protein
MLRTEAYSDSSARRVSIRVAQCRAMAKDKQTYSVELEPAKAEFLDQMARTHGLPDMGKAIRCLVDYARENPQAQEEIFGGVHCVDCG